MKLSSIYSNGMIIQRNKENILEGNTDANRTVKVSFATCEYETTSDDKGNFKIKLPKMEAGGPYDLTIEADQKLFLSDIYVGDVFLLSGQSNMELMIFQTLDINEEYVKNLPDYPLIRTFQLPRDFKFGSPDEILSEGEWVTANSETVYFFSALGFFFAELKYKKDGIPVGLVNASLGGTHIEAFMSEKQVIKSGENLIEMYKKAGKEIKCNCSIHDTCKVCYKEAIEKNKDSEYVQNRIKSDLEKVEKWDKKLNEDDLGLRDKWYEKEWSGDFLKDCFDVTIPGSWIGNDPLNGKWGSVWLQTTFDVPKGWIDGKVQLRLGTIVDGDITYLNGKEVGTTGFFYPPRRYWLEEGVLKEGKNILTVRVMVTNNVGEFKKDMPYCLKCGDREISLEGVWTGKIACVKEERQGDMMFFFWQPTSLYNKMIYPIRNLKFNSILFYQGESNSRYPEEYEFLMKDMINEWRTLFGESVPFIFAELPFFQGESWEGNHYAEGEDGWEPMRISQRKVAKDVENTKLINLFDLGQYNEIHPQNKRLVAERFFKGYEEITGEQDD